MAGLALLFMNEVTAPRRLAVGSVMSDGVAGAPGLYYQAVDPLDIEVLDPDNPYTVITTLPLSLDRQFRDAPSEVGSGSVAIQLDDPAISAFSSSVSRMIRFRVNNRAAFQMLVEKMERKTHNQGEEAQQRLVLTGRGVVSILEEAVTYPTRGPATLPIEDSRIFNFANEDFNDSGWGPAALIAYQDNQLFNWRGLPARWPAPSAGWIWAPGSTQVFAESGTCYFRHFFYVPAGVDKITIFLAIDDDGELWFDGQPLIEMTHFAEYNSVTIPVTAGTHLLAAKCRNDPKYNTLLGGGTTDQTYTVVSGDTLWDISGRYYDDPTRWPVIYNANQAQIDADAAAAGLPYTGRWAGHWIFPGQVLTLPGITIPGLDPFWFNPAGLLCAVYAGTEDGLGTLLTVSNGSWRCLPYPVEEPGMTVGEVLGILLTEAQLRGCFPDLVWTFTTNVDSAGRPWRKTGDIAIRVGDDMLTVLTQLAETYIDFAMAPAGLVLDCFDIDTPEGGVVAAFTPGTNMTELNHTRDL